MAEEKEVENTGEPTAPEAAEPSEPEKETPEVPVAEKEQTIPKSRFDEVNNERNELREQNRLLIEMQSRSNKPPAPEPEMEYLDPAVKTLADKNKRLEMALGGVANKLDKMEAQGNPAFKDYSKYDAKIERVHADMLRGGQFISRSLIYTHLKGQEALKGGNRTHIVEKEPEIPSAIPQTKAAVKISAVPKKPETLEQKAERLKNVKF